MKTIYYPGCFKKAWNNRYFNAIEYSPEVLARVKGLTHWEELRNEGVSACRSLGLVIEAFGGSTDYWYRWKRRFRECGRGGLECRSRRPHHVRERTWDSKVLKRIVTLRDHPETCRWGASKLRVQLLREGRKPPSGATLERMITHLKHTKAILPLPVAKKRSTRRLSPSGWRTRFKKAVHGAISRIQIDVDRYHYRGQTWYHFSAIHVPTRWVWAESYSRATARNATAFLSHIRSNLPPGMPVETIQVDGGSEFMKEFSASCEEHGIALLVNHPHTPQQNCFVERVHRTFDEELYQVLDIPDTLSEMNEMLEEYVAFYNHHRPHAGIGHRTPCEQLEEWSMLQEPGRVA